MYAIGSKVSHVRLGLVAFYAGKTISGTIHVRYTDEQYFGAINRGVRLPEMWDASETRPYRNRQR
jgi:hypothetical protein